MRGKDEQQLDVFSYLNMDDPIWDVTVFNKNRERLLDADIANLPLQSDL